MTIVAPRAAAPSPALCDGSLLAGRYRVLHPNGKGWRAFDERLTRPVLIEVIVGNGAPDERVRREVSSGAALLDAFVFGSDSYAVRGA
jgi:hypothetical protein